MCWNNGKLGDMVTKEELISLGYRPMKNDRFMKLKSENGMLTEECIALKDGVLYVTGHILSLQTGKSIDKYMCVIQDLKQLGNTHKNRKRKE